MHEYEPIQYLVQFKEYFVFAKSYISRRTLSTFKIELYCASRKLQLIAFCHSKESHISNIIFDIELRKSVDCRSRLNTIYNLHIMSAHMEMVSLIL